MILMIDNYDSFTYNLVQYIRQLDSDTVVYRNDAITVDEIHALAPEGIVISPGPGRPEEAGVSMDVVREFAGTVPIFGVCLGHQVIATVFGATVVRAGRVMHGKVSRVKTDGRGVFAGLDEFDAMRYHSLAVDESTLPDELEISARALDDNEIMGIRHTTLAVEGVQFHPESIMTGVGMAMLDTFLATCRKEALG